MLQGKLEIEINTESMVKLYVLAFCILITAAIVTKLKR